VASLEVYFIGLITRANRKMSVFMFPINTKQVEESTEITIN